MSVYIKGMEMPKSCWTCFARKDVDIDVGITDGCDLLKTMIYNPKERLDNCPLVPVPPHGDLIDKKTVSENLASVLNKKNPPFSYPDWNDAIIAMLTSPTIIPAEEG